MLKELLNNLQTLKNEVDQINQLPENQREAATAALAEKVLNTLEDAAIPLSEQYTELSGEQIPTSEV
jgi:DNA-binding ferritin-like protein